MVSLATEIQRDVNSIGIGIGKVVTLRQVAGSTLIDETMPSKGYTQTFTDYLVYAVPYGFELSEIDGNLVQKDDIRMVVSLYEVSTVPKMDDKIIDDNDVTWHVVNVMKHEVEGTIVAATLHLRN